MTDYKKITGVVLVTVAVSALAIYYMYGKKESFEDKPVEQALPMTEKVDEPVEPDTLKDISKEIEFLKEKTQAQITSNDLLPPGENLYNLENKNFLFNTFGAGSDSRGTSLKNPNLQLRSDPVIERVENLTPFNKSIVEGQDTYRKRFEIGGN